MEQNSCAASRRTGASIFLAPQVRCSRTRAGTADQCRAIVSGRNRIRYARVAVFHTLEKLCRPARWLCYRARTGHEFSEYAPSRSASRPNTMVGAGRNGLISVDCTFRRGSRFDRRIDSADRDRPRSRTTLRARFAAIRQVCLKPVCAKRASWPSPEGSFHRAIDR